jgi:hypothetical protein
MAKSMCITVKTWDYDNAVFGLVLVLYPYVSLFIDENISSLSTFCPLVASRCRFSGRRRVIMWAKMMLPNK